MNEESRRLQLRQVLRPQLLWLARRMQWIRQQEQTIHQPWLIRAKHRGLTPAIRMAAKKYLAGSQLAHCLDGALQTFPIACRISGMRRSKWALLAKREIATKHYKTRASQGFCYGHEKRALAIRSRAMGEN